MTFPEDFKKTIHRVYPSTYQYKATKLNGQTISIVGGAPGLYGDGITTFEMWDFDEENPRGYLTIDEINDYLKTVELNDELEQASIEDQLVLLTKAYN